MGEVDEYSEMSTLLSLYIGTDVQVYMFLYTKLHTLSPMHMKNKNRK